MKNYENGGLEVGGKACGQYLECFNAPGRSPDDDDILFRHAS
jgi:hypothetical protein